MKRTTLTPEIKHEVMSLYSSGVKVMDIANRLDIAYKSVYNILNKGNCKPDRAKVIPNETRTAIIKAYEDSDSISAAKLSKVYSVTREYVCKILAEAGHNVAEEAPDRRRKVKHNPFIDLKDHNTQYILGLLSTDGFLRDNTIGFCSIDIEQINNYIDFIGVPLHIVKHRVMKQREHLTYYVTFKNPEVAQWLTSLGITQNKSLTIKVNFDFTFAFLRGVIDGNGYIGRTKSNGGFRYTLSVITGSPAFQKQVFDFLLSNGFSPKLRSLAANRYHVNLYRQSELIKLRDLLYADAKYFLPRKKEVFFQLGNDMT